MTEGQLALATAFFRQTKGFFLTGGAVLAGWELVHRPTDDLDLFTDSDEVMRQGEAALAAASVSRASLKSRPSRSALSSAFASMPMSTAASHPGP